MPLQKILKPILPSNLRTIPRSFAWIDHELRTKQFLLDFQPEEFALYLFLALAADQQGLSCWRLDVLEKSMPAFRYHQFWSARNALVNKRLLAFKPWSPSDPDGLYQLLPVSLMPPKRNGNSDLQTIIASVIKSVS